MASILTETDIAVLCVTTLFLIATIISNFVDIRSLKIIHDRVDDLEKQIANISKTSAEFFCAIDNRIADISTAFDCCDVNIDALFDEENKINESIIDLKRSVECINCKLHNPLSRL